MVSFQQVDKFIVKELTLHIPKGIAVGIIGASGAGKTTLLKLACGLLCPEKGKVYTFQKDSVEHRSEIGGRLGCLLEGMPVFDVERSVKDNMKDLQIAYRMPDVEFQREYTALAERFGIQEVEQTQVKTLSFGQRRRAELVAVLLHRPKLLLLDEPTNALDENAKSTLQEVLRERMAQGMSVVLTSHDMQAVSGLCERIVVLEQGRLLYYGEKEALLRTYAPMDTMYLSYEGAVPDMEDLPLERYSVESGTLTLAYNSNYVTASEILEVLLRQISIQEVSVRKPNLQDVIFAIRAASKEGNNK